MNAAFTRMTRHRKHGQTTRRAFVLGSPWLPDVFHASNRYEDEDMAGTKRKRAVTATTGKTKKKSMENEDETGGTVEGEERVSKKAKVADGASKLESDPQAVQVRKWRHKLQKTLLTNESLPKEEVRVVRVVPC
ncbi:hypothetical protein B0H10DRAFT_2232662 [Mycena sp. CBHHK59/15]|nr:hypothetical protein B0H10DRAFT_2232662 [Mycena sp. CBHHK59/15]